MRDGGTLYSDVPDTGAATAVLRARRTERARRDAWERMAILSPGTGLPAYSSTSGGIGKAFTVLNACFPKSNGRRSVPSAGASYPFELYAVVREAEDLALFHLDPARRLCRRLETGAAGWWETTGLALPDADEAIVFVVSRPWLSMRKYGDRGYLYAQLDIAHLAANLLGLAQDLGFTAELRLGFARTPAAEALGFGTRCREIHSALRLSAGDVGGRAAGWSVRDGRAASADGGDVQWWLEAACWTSLSPLLDTGDEDRGRAAIQARPPVDLRTDLGFGPSFPSGASWAALSGNRLSSKGFEPIGLARPALWQAVSACQAPLASDVGPDSAVAMTLVVRDVPGLAPGVYHATEAGGDVPGVVPNGDEIVRACLQQEHLRHAAAFAVFHVSHEELVAAGPHRVREMLFRIGAAGQLVYLGATEAGVGVTGVGGFDAGCWRQLARLAPDREPLYLVALGWDDARGVKWDRFPTAYAQNER